MWVFRSNWAMLAVAAVVISGLPHAAEAQDVKSVDAIVKGLAPVKTRGRSGTRPVSQARRGEQGAECGRADLLCLRLRRD
jgi:hypothetical protein